MSGSRIRAVALLVVLIVLVPRLAFACPVCYGDTDSPMVAGMNNAILVLLGIVGVVQVGFIALFWSFWKRSKLIRQRREQFHLIKGMAR